MQPLYSEYTNDIKAFSAISSLCSHLDATLSEDDFIDPMDFYSDDSNISTLWSSALESSSSKEVSLAMTYYYQAASTNSIEARNFLIESKTLLLDSWRSLNPYTEQTDVVVKCDCDNETPRQYSLENQRKYLLPKDSPLREPLRKIFSNPDVLKSPKTFSKAGFIVISERPSGMFVAAHPKLPGHLVKTYIESKKIKPNWQWAVYRCLGAQYIRELIKEKNLNHFVVPNKWIYPLTPIRNNDDIINNSSPVILIVTDMQLVEKSASKKEWKNNVTKTHIQQLYCILSHGYSSCCLGSNIPYTKKGKFTCIDTEVPERTLPLHHVGRYLSEEMSDYWDYLVKTDGRGSPYK